MKVLNNKTNNFYSDEWYTDRNIVKIVKEELEMDFKNKIVMCPFDSEKSEFVKVAKEMSNNVIYGIEDFLEKEYNYDLLYTNPPFSIKDAVIEKVLKSNKPSALILPLDSLGGVKRHLLYNKYAFPFVVVPNRRINYTDKSGIKQNRSSMHSVICIFNTDKSGIKYINVKK